MPNSLRHLLFPEKLLWPCGRDIGEGALVEQSRIHHTLVGQVLDNHVDEFDLRGRSNTRGDEVTEDCAHHRAIEPNQGEHEPAKPLACLTGALDKPLYLDSDPNAYFARLRSLTEDSADAAESWLAEPPEADVTLTPKRDVDRQVLRSILAAIRNEQSVEIHYQSMNKARPDPGWRRITPHALGYDGLRWHVRAFSHDDGSYRDFLLPRALQVRAPGEPGGSAENDRLWHQHFKLEIAPHPALTPSQRKVVAKDGMAGGKRVISVRHAMLFYVLKRLNLLNDPEKEDPRQQHIVVLNKDEVQQALDMADSAPQGPKASVRMAKSVVGLVGKFGMSVQSGEHT